MRGKRTVRHPGGGDKRHYRESDLKTDELKVAGRVADLLRVPFVVFGHSHVPEASQAAASTRYFNTGSWTAGGLTHLCILIAPGSPVAELRRFCLDSHLPMALDAAAVE